MVPPTAASALLHGRGSSSRRLGQEAARVCRCALLACAPWSSSAGRGAGGAGRPAGLAPSHLKKVWMLASLAEGGSPPT